MIRDKPLFSSVDGICFDLDGTLLDTLEDIADSCNRVFASLGLPTYGVEAHRNFIGEGVVRLFERALPDNSDPQRIHECVARFKVEYGAGWNRKSRPFSGIMETLIQLERRGVKLAVLSNKPHVFTKKCVDYFFAEVPFEPVFGQRDGVPRKPDPAGAFEIARHLTLAPQCMLYVGDSVVDMQTARAAGMRAVAVGWGYQAGDLLLDNGAESLIQQPAELLGIVKDACQER